MADGARQRGTTKVAVSKGDQMHRAGVSSAVTIAIIAWRPDREQTGIAVERDRSPRVIIAR